LILLISFLFKGLNFSFAAKYITFILSSGILKYFIISCFVWCEIAIILSEIFKVIGNINLNLKDVENVYVLENK